jgi:hypothetical protein
MSPCRHLAMSPSRHVAISPCRHVASVATLMQARSRCTLNRAMLITTHALQSFGSTGTQGKKVINVPRADAFFCFKTFFIVLANPDARTSDGAPGNSRACAGSPEDHSAINTYSKSNMSGSSMLTISLKRSNGTGPPPLTDPHGPR